MKRGLVVSVTPIDEDWKRLRVVADNNGVDIVSRAIAAVKEKFSTAEELNIWLSVSNGTYLDRVTIVKTVRELYCGTYYVQDGTFDPNGTAE